MVNADFLHGMGLASIIAGALFVILAWVYRRMGG